MDKPVESEGPSASNPISVVPPKETVACIYDDIFHEDYRQYIAPWDGVTKIKIAPRKFPLQRVHVPTPSKTVQPPA